MELRGLKHFNDGDEWMLAEDIPGADFFFSQIFLCAFVNNLKNSCGMNYSKILAVFRGDRMKFYYGKKNCYDMTLHLVNKIKSDPSFGEKINDNILRYSDELEEFSINAASKDLQKYGDSELNKIIQEFVKIHTKLYEWGWLSNATDMFYPEYTELLKSYLKRHVKSEEELNTYFIALTQPDERSKEAEQHEELLRIGIEIEDSPEQTELFQSSGPREIIEKADKHILSLIDDYTNMYGMMGALWVYKPFAREHFIQELSNYFRECRSAAEDLEAIEDDLKVKKMEKEELFKKLKVDKKHERLFRIFSRFMLTKFYRRYAQIRSFYAMRKVFREIEKRFNLSFLQARFLLTSEYEDLLVKKSFELKKIKEREKFCVLYSEEGHDIIFVGAEAKKLAEGAESRLSSDMSEVKGQCASLGYAKGRVKIILIGSDIKKMEKGDILVAIATNPDVVPAMKKAAAIVTEQGGVTCHAAIVSRELNIPCVIGTKVATKWLKDGDLVEVDATHGLVRKL